MISAPITIRLPWITPPIRSNDRLHWGAEARLRKQVRQDVARLVRADRFLPLGIDYPVIVTLIWEVADHRVRDASSGAPTCKAAVDGLRDGRLLVEDRHEIVTEERCLIEFGDRVGVRMEIRAVPETNGAAA